VEITQRCTAGFVVAQNPAFNVLDADFLGRPYTRFTVSAQHDKTKSNGHKRIANPTAEASPVRLFYAQKKHHWATAYCRCIHNKILKQ